MPDPVPAGTPGGGTAPPPAVSAGEGAVAPQVAGTGEGGTGADALLERLKAAGVTANDLEQVQRYYAGHGESRGYKTRIGELESDEYKDRVTADRLMSDVDASLTEEHKQWRATYGDKAYIEARKAQLAEVAGQRPAETPDEQLSRRLERLEAALVESKEKREYEERERVFNSDLDKILGGLKLPDRIRKFLRSDVQRSVTENVTNAAQLADFVQQRHAEIQGLMQPEAKATPPAPPTTPPSSTPPPEGGSETPPSPGGEPETIEDLFKVIEQQAAGSSEAGAGAG